MLKENEPLVEYPTENGIDDRGRSGSEGFTTNENKPAASSMNSTSGETTGAIIGLNLDFRRAYVNQLAGIGLNGEQ